VFTDDPRDITKLREVNKQLIEKNKKQAEEIARLTGIVADNENEELLKEELWKRADELDTERVSQMIS